MQLCAFYKRALPFWVDEPATPRWLGRHLARCASCRAVWDEERRFVRQIVSHPPAGPGPVPYLRSRIMAQIRAEKIEPEKAWPWRPAAFGALALSAAAVVIFMVLPQKAPEPPQVAALVPATPVAANLSQVLDGARIIRLVDKIDEPLEEEIQSVVHDARTALNSLAYNFLPARGLETDW